MCSTHQWHKRILPWLLVLGLSPTALADDITGRAQALIEAGNTKDAYLLLEPLETDRAGDPVFDLLLGIAAVNEGQNTRGVFALERVLSQEPNNARARAEIARAYLALGETDTARTEFNAVRKQDIPPEVARTIDRYLAAVDQQQSSKQTALTGYLEAQLGYDSNVNAAPGDSQIAIPMFGGALFTLDHNSRAQGAGFARLGGGLSLHQPLGSDLALVIGASGYKKFNSGKSRFDTSNADLNVGLAWRQNLSTWSLTGQYNNFWLDDADYRRAAGLTGQWQHALNPRSQISAFVQYADLNYHGQRIRDADRWVYGGAYAHALSGGQVIFTSLYGITENEKAHQMPWLGHSGHGLRLGAQTRSDQPLIYFANLSIEQRRYGGSEPAFLKKRKDTQYDLTLGAHYRLAPRWSLSPSLSYTKNSSGVKINDYRRTIASLSLRRSF